MNEREYNRRSLAENGGFWNVPDQFRSADGGLDIDGLLDFIAKEEYLGLSITGQVVFHPRFEIEQPDLHKLIKSIHRDAEQAQMDALVVAGLVNQSINDRAELVYRANDGTLLLNSWA